MARDVRFHTKYDIISGLSDGEIQELINSSLDIDQQILYSPNITPRESEHSTQRFDKPVTADELQQEIRSAIPSNTLKRNKWVTNLFKKWIQQRECVEQNDHANIPSQNAKFEDLTLEQLRYWLPKFIYEVRKSDGSLYPQGSLVTL